MIPTYNQSAYLKQCVDSALQQDYGNLEIVISDDSDNCLTENLIASNYLCDGRVKYFRNSQRLGRVRNYRKTLEERASGEYVLNMDGDDWLSCPSYIREAVSMLDNNAQAVCVMAGIKCLDEQAGELTEEPLFTEFPTFIKGTDYLMLNAKKVIPFNHLTALYRRENALALDFYSVNTIWTDSQSLFRLIYTGDIGFVTRHVGVWRLHGNNESRKFFAEVKPAQLFMSEQTVMDFFEKVGSRNNFDSRKWFSLWKYNHTKEYVIYLLKEHESKKLLIFLSYLVVQHPGFFLTRGPGLLAAVFIRWVSYTKRVLLQI